jgi:peptide/nickel transport system substrate-binding protein
MTWCSPPTASRAKGSNFTTGHSDRCQGRQDRRLHRRFRADLAQPDPDSQWDTWYIMDKKWAEANNAVAPTPAAATSPSFASLNANGTGPFTIESHQPGVKTVFKVNPNWWNKQARAQSQGDHLHADRLRCHPRRGAAVRRGRRHRAGADPGHRARQWISQRPGADRAGAAHHLPRHGPDPRRAAVPTSRARIRSRTSASARPSTRRSTSRLIKSRVMRGLSTPSALMIAPELFPSSPAFRGRNSTPTAPRSCWPRPAIPTVSKSAWIAPMIAMSTTPRSARRWSACSRASASR